MNGRDRKVYKAKAVLTTPQSPRAINGVVVLANLSSYYNGGHDD